jgi:hypothetical protein
MGHEWDLPSIGLRNLSAKERLQFWDLYQAARPETRYRWGNTYSRWSAVPGTNLNLSLYITNHSVGLFVRGERGASLTSTRVLLQPRAPALQAELGARLDAEAPLLTSLALATTDPANWARAHRWLAEHETIYMGALGKRG